MSLLELWKVLGADLQIIVTREGGAREILFEGESNYLPEQLFPMRVTYVDIEESDTDNSYALYISVEELKGEDNA